MIARFTVAVLTVLALASRGGGGGPSQPADDTAPIVRAAGGEPLNLSNAQVRREIGGIQARSTSLLMTDVDYGSGTDRISCSGATCTETDGTTIYISDFDSSTQTFSPIMTRNGVKITQGAGRVQTRSGASVDVRLYGGWMDHGAFLVYVGQGTFDFQGQEFEYANGAAFGAASGSVPSGGSARCRGVMAGVDTAREEGLQGNASLTADFAARNVDVALFTNVRDIEDAALGNSIRFKNVPMTSDGFSQGSRFGNRIRGTFHGPGHAEAGGMFEHGTILGSFGARRQ